jgi:hypothetical protein
MRDGLPQDPKVVLQTAIEELDVFTQSEASRLEVGENGRLVAARESRLERMVSLARSYIGPLFSDQVKKNQEKRLGELKKAILQARDIIQSHSRLIAKFKEGDEAQQKLAESALVAILRYNAIVARENSSEMMKSDVYNYERERLLLDQEIKGQPIELPNVITIKYDSHPDSHPAQKMLKVLSQALYSDIPKKPSPSISPTHKKTLQFMIDTFHMKAIRMMQTHVQNPMAEIVQLVKQNTPEIEEDGSVDLITMRQLIELDAGSVILVTGCFKKNISNSKFMTMPILDSFRLSFQLTHSGFPYSSQYTGWSLTDKWIDASPLRTDQVPLFQQVNQRRKRLAHQLLFDQGFIQKVRRHFKIKREVFDQNRNLFLPLHLQLQRALQHGMSLEDHSVLELFFEEAAQAPSAYDHLVQTQQQILDLFIQYPFSALEEEWLGLASTPLRAGLPQDKFQAACSRLEQHREGSMKNFDSTCNRHAYILHQGPLLGKAFQAVGLQYQSEKMGFSPPFLKDFERKLQICAFQQLLTFLDECEHQLEILDPAQIKEDLLKSLSKDIHILDFSAKEEEDALPLAIVNELEVYFNSRFYSRPKYTQTT